jgi:hypothetical protein
MSQVFLDPNTYCYTRDEWAGGAALDRLEALLDLVNEIDTAERHIEAEKRVSFILPDDLLLRLYNENPYLNDPPNPHYFRIFTNKILPALQRRKTAMLEELSGIEILSEHIDTDSCVAEDALNSFLNSISTEEASRITYAYHPHRVSIQLGSGCFEGEVPITDVNGAYFVDYNNLFPIHEKRNPAKALKEAASIFLERLSLGDSTWKSYSMAGIVIHEDFIPSLSKADFRGDADKYQTRIVYAILQILVGRPITTSEHSMKPQTISFGDAKHGKWNAYVFKSGPSPIDTRCSRIYFAKVTGGVLFFRYEEDAHS